MWSRLKRNDKIGLFFFVAFIISASLIWLFEERFDKDRWLLEPSKRYEMVDDIIESQILMDKTTKQVFSLLGQPSEIKTSKDTIFLYSIGTPPSFIKSEPELLLIRFYNGMAKTITLAQD